MTALDWMLQCYPNIKDKEEMRKIIGRFGLTGQQQVRFVFKNCHLLLRNRTKSLFENYWIMISQLYILTIVNIFKL